MIDGAMPLSELHRYQPEDLFLLLDKTYSAKRTDKSKRKLLTSELSQSIYEQLCELSDATFHIQEQCPGLGFRAIGYEKKPVEAKNPQKNGSAKRAYRNENYQKNSIVSRANWLLRNNCEKFGIACGALADGKYLTVLDLDFTDTLQQQRLLSMLGVKTYINRTPRGGLHLYFLSEKYCGQARYDNGTLALDVKGANNNFVVSAGFTDRNGKRYVGDADNDFYQLELGTLPDNWRDILDAFFGITREEQKSSIAVCTPSKRVKKYTVPSANKASVLPDVIREGSRNNALLRYAGSVVRSFSTEQTLFDEMRSIADVKCENGTSISDKEVWNIVSYVWNKERGEESSIAVCTHPSRPINLSDKPYTKSFLQTLSKSEEHTANLQHIAGLYQSWMEHYIGHRYSKPMDINAMARMLKASGYSMRRVGHKQARLWNISTTLAETAVASLVVRLPKQYSKPSPKAPIRLSGGSSIPNLPNPSF